MDTFNNPSPLPSPLPHPPQTNGQQTIGRNKKTPLLIGGVFLIFVIGTGILFFFLSRSKLSQSGEMEQQPDSVVPAQFEHDLDRDGIDDITEKELGTSDFEFDTDGDGLSDSSEVFIWKTDPTNSDTDGDGVSDGFEVLHGRNPIGEGALNIQELVVPQSEADISVE